MLSKRWSLSGAIRTTVVALGPCLSMLPTVTKMRHVRIAILIKARLLDHCAFVRCQKGLTTVTRTESFWLAIRIPVAVFGQLCCRESCQQSQGWRSLRCARHPRTVLSSPPAKCGAARGHRPRKCLISGWSCLRLSVPTAAGLGFLRVAVLVSVRSRLACVPRMPNVHLTRSQVAILVTVVTLGPSLLLCDKCQQAQRRAHSGSS